MKKTELNRFLPFEADYTLLGKCRLWGTRELATIGACSIILPLLDHYSSVEIVNIIYTILNYIYFLLIVSYYILDIYTETLAP